MIVQDIFKKEEGTKLQILAPYELKRENLDEIIASIRREGYLRIYLNNVMYDIDDPTAIPFDPKKKNSLYIVIDRLMVKRENTCRIREAISNATRIGKKKIAILENDKLHAYYLDFADPVTGESFPPITPKTFGFNTLEGACPNCQGLGTEYGCNVLKEEAIATCRSTSCSSISPTSGSRCSTRSFRNRRSTPTHRSSRSQPKRSRLC